jgi:hypothetical protein
MGQLVQLLLREEVHMFTFTFWKDTTERAVRNAATSFIAVSGAEATFWNLSPEALIGIPTAAAILEIAVSLSTAGIGQRGTAGIVNTASVTPNDER